MAYVPVILLGAAWILAALLSLTGNGLFVEELLRYTLLLSVGVQGLWAFIGHCFFSKQTAKHIGWQSNQFQYEIGVCNLSYGTLGILSFHYTALWVATAIGISIFMLGAAAIHINDMARRHNFAPGNAGAIFYTDILTPLSLLGALYWKHAS